MNQSKCSDDSLYIRDTSPRTLALLYRVYCRVYDYGDGLSDTVDTTVHCCDLMTIEDAIELMYRQKMADFDFIVDGLGDGFNCEYWLVPEFGAEATEPHYSGPFDDSEYLGDFEPATAF